MAIDGYPEGHGRGIDPALFTCAGSGFVDDQAARHRTNPTKNISPTLTSNEEVGRLRGDDDLARCQ